MSVQLLPGASIPLGGYIGYPGGQPALATALTIDATGEKVAFVGRVWHGARTGSKSVRTVGFRFGAVTKAGGSGLTVSLQDVSTAAGPPMQPDETQDQTVAIANGNASFASDTWIQTGNLSADRPVAFGELLAVVIEFDGSGRQGADSVVVSGLVGAQTGPSHHAMSLLKTASFAVQPVVPNVILGFTDGTFGTLMGAFPFSALGTIAYNTGSASDEIALEVSFPGPVQIDAVGGIWTHANASADAEVVVYSGTSALSTQEVYGDHGTANTAYRPAAVLLDAALSLDANTTYRVALKPTSANNVTVNYFDVVNADHLQAHIGGTAWRYIDRADAGAWNSATTTRRPFLWPHVCGIDDAVSVGGGGGGRRPRLVTVS